MRHCPSAQRTMRDRDCAPEVARAPRHDSPGVGAARVHFRERVDVRDDVGIAAELTLVRLNAELRATPPVIRGCKDKANSTHVAVHSSWRGWRQSRIVLNRDFPCATLRPTCPAVSLCSPASLQSARQYDAACAECAGWHLPQRRRSAGSECLRTTFSSLRAPHRGITCRPRRAASSGEQRNSSKFSSCSIAPDCSLW